MAGLAASAKIVIHRPIDYVFNAVAEGTVMGKYWFHRKDQSMREGETTFWYVGSADDAIAIPVHVIEMKKPTRIQMRWGESAVETNVLWIFEVISVGSTRLSVTENGYRGNDQDVLQQALESTGGFNQAVVAMKAWLEHKAVVNIVADHA